MPRSSEKRRLQREIDWILTIDFILRLLNLQQPAAAAVDDDNDHDDESQDVTNIEMIPFIPKAPNTALLPTPFIRKFLSLLSVALPEVRYMEPRIALPRIVEEPISWFIQTVPDDRFKSLFRMGRNAFQEISEELSHHSIFTNQSHCAQAHPAIQLAVFLFRAGSPGTSTVRTATSLGIGDGTVQLYCRRVIIALLSLTSKYIAWPQGRQLDEVQRQIADGTDGDFERCVGFLDGSVIPLRNKPREEAEAYFSRKKIYGLNVQAVCDWNRRFTFVFAGHCGSVHDNRAYRGTSLFKTPEKYFPAREYILADKGYGISPRIVIPYKEPLANHPRRRRFNKHLSQARVKIEHAFGICKARFLSLTSLPFYIRSPDDHIRAVEWIVSCFVLHNMILSVDARDDWFSMDIEADDDDQSGLEKEEAEQEQEQEQEQETVEADGQAGDRKWEEAMTRSGKALREELKAHIRYLDEQRDILV
ncbi:hypothetical protein ABW20_dc0109962 [Dactylellina cionopaga]|nr:hypothetical protein ABW20_dc0109962 [Dactylellina cionopaga]